MSEEKMMRLSQVARNLNVGLSTIAEHLTAKGFNIENNPNSKISVDQYNMLLKEFESSAIDKKEASGLTIGTKRGDSVVVKSDSPNSKKNKDDDEEIFIKNLSSQSTQRDKDETAQKEIKKKAEKDKEKKDKEEIEEKEKAKEAEAEKISAEEDPSLSKVKLQGIKVVGKIELGEKKTGKTTKAKEEKIPKKTSTATPEITEKPVKAEEKEKPVEKGKKEKEPEKEKQEDEVVGAKADTLKGLTVLGKIELPEKAKRKDDGVPDTNKNNKKKRKRVRIGLQKGETKPGGPTVVNPPRVIKPAFHRGKPNVPTTPKGEVSDKEIQDKIKATLAKLSGGKGQVNRSKYRKEKRSAAAEANEEKMLQEQEDSKTLKVTEYISANDLASLMDVTVNEVISACLGLGMFVSINQRLDAEAITVIADEFNYSVEFTSAEAEQEEEEEEEDVDTLETRAPIVTIMGHVDHGKTSLLDYIRKSKVVQGEAGGITQHIGAYNVLTDSGKKITFLDTPGHEAFTAMRARGAKLTDIVIIVVAADDSVMPQTREAINHAQVAGVPIIIAINKIDKPAANADKIKEELSKLNILVEDWGGKYQCELISAKSGLGIPTLLEKILLEAEILELKANPNKRAIGTVVEASLDKGRGYLSTVLVQSGTLNIGDVIVAGAHYGRVKAMTDHRGTRLKIAGPSTPIQVLGLNGAPQAGDKFQVMETEREAREIANKREQLLREQSIRTKKHITLDEIGRRLAIGNFKELNVIVKGDVDGSIEALSDSLLKLSTQEIQVRIIHKAVGAISESDVLLASASDAVIVGFQVRPSSSAKKLAEAEEIEIRLYSIIYDAINDVKDAMEGMLAPKVEEIVTGSAEVRQVFKISKIGTIAGSYITDGIIKRSNQVRLVRDGIVVFTGKISALKRMKDDASEVKTGYECGISLQGFNDIVEKDIIEAFEVKETKRTL